MPEVIGIKEQKSLLRDKFKKIRLSMSTCQKQEIDSQIADKFLSLKEYKNCDTVFAYISTDIEVDTHKIILTALSQGKKVAVPKCDIKTCTMMFYLINSFDDVSKGAYGILEPDINVCKKAQKNKNSLCIVPGLSFDESGFRLGFGKGYYDRFLSNFLGTSVGLCYDECISHTLPHDFYDKQTDIVVTQNYVNSINK